MLRNCFNYVGSKDRILPTIHNNLDTSKEFFVDVFCGSGVVGLSVVDLYKAIVINDACWQMIKTLRYFRDNSTEDILNEISSVIKEYELSKENKEGYISLRATFNDSYCQEETFNPIIFYCLLTHSFNYNIHINKSGGFSVPFGKNRSYFSDSLKAKFQLFQGKLHENKSKVNIKCSDFGELILNSKEVIKNSLFYFDPPYLSSDSSYGRIQYLGKWDAQKEKRLYKALDYINDEGGSFILSNVIENNGHENSILKEWSSKYNIVDVSSDFTNCNYQRKNLGKTHEVLVRNY